MIHSLTVCCFMYVCPLKLYVHWHPGVCENYVNYMYVMCEHTSVPLCDNNIIIIKILTFNH